MGRVAGKFIAPPKGNIPDIEETFEIGKLMGLDEKDIMALHKKNRSIQLKMFLLKYWYLIIPIIALLLCLTYIYLDYIGIKARRK